MQFEKMNPEIKAKWLEALRSGKYTQGRSVLRSTTGTHCCLGVLCEVAVIDGVTELIEVKGDDIDYHHFGFGAEGDYWTSFLPPEVVKWACVGEAQTELAGLNDKSDSFEPTIDWIEGNL